MWWPQMLTANSTFCVSENAAIWREAQDELLQVFVCDKTRFSTFNFVVSCWFWLVCSLFWSLTISFIRSCVTARMSSLVANEDSNLSSPTPTHPTGTQSPLSADRWESRLRSGSCPPFWLLGRLLSSPTTSRAWPQILSFGQSNNIHDVFKDSVLTILYLTMKANHKPSSK